MFGMVFEKLRSCNIKVLDKGNGEYILVDRTGYKWIMTARELVLRNNEALATLKAGAKHPSKRFKISEIKHEMKNQKWVFHPDAVNCAFFPAKKDTDQVDSRGGTGLVGSPAPVSYPDASEMEHLPETVVIDESVGSESSFSMTIVDAEIMDGILDGEDRHLLMKKYNVDEDYLSGLCAKHLGALHKKDEVLAVGVSRSNINYQNVSNTIKQNSEGAKRAKQGLEQEGKKIENAIEFAQGQIDHQKNNLQLFYKQADEAYARAAEAEKRKVVFEEIYENHRKLQEEVSSSVRQIQRERGMVYSEKLKAYQKKQAAETAKEEHELQMKRAKEDEMAFLGKRKEPDESLGATDNKVFLKGMLGYFTGGAEAEKENEKPFEECAAKATPLRSRVEKASSGRPRRTPRKPRQVQRFTYE